MLRQRNFDNDLVLVTDDFRKPQQFTRESFDALVENAVSNLRYYTGFTAVRTGAAEVTVSSGHYWAGGPVFVRAEPTIFNLLQGGNYIPAVTKRYVAIVTYGETVATDTQDRLYETDDQGTKESRPLDVETLRIARLALVPGVQQPDPQKPVLDAGLIPVAWILLDTSGVVSVEQEEDYRLPSIESLSQLIDNIEEWRAHIGQSINTLFSELVRIQASIPADNSALLAALLARIEQLEDVAKQPASAVQSFLDRFISLRDSDTEYAGYNAEVGSGLTFGGGTPTYAEVVLNNPLDPKVKVANNILTPAQSGKAARLSIDKPDSVLSISQYTVQVVERVRKLLTRTVHEYVGAIVFFGKEQFNAINAHRVAEQFGISANDATGWLAKLHAQLDVMDAAEQRIGKFQFKGPTGGPLDINFHHMTSSNGSFFSINYKSVKSTKVDEPYWENITTDATVNGSQVAQTFLNATNGWLSEIGLYFGQVALAGDVNVYITEVEGGKPVNGSVISSGTIPVASLNTMGEIKCAMTPVYLEGGRSYAMMLVSTGNHFVRVREGDKYPSGAAYYLSDTKEWLPVQNSGDICMNLYFPAFAQTRVEVAMQPLTRAGGISSIRINAAQYEPKGTKLVWEIQRAGRWYQLSEGEYGALTGAPTLVNLRAVFIGTRDLMPAIDMSQTEITLLGEENTFTHVSEIHELDAATDEVRVRYDIQGWDEGVHDIDCDLIIPGSPDTIEAPDTLTITPSAGDATTVRVEAVFTPSAITDYRVKTTGTRGLSDSAFVVTERRDHAL